MENNNSSLIKIDKLNSDLCFYFFKKIFFESEKKCFFDYLDLSCIQEMENLYIRSTAWKLYLNVLPMNNNISEWVSVIEERRNFYKMKKKDFTKVKKFKNDPLLNNSWDYIPANQELKKIINIDLARTFQEYENFHFEDTKEILFNVLFIWSSINKDISYRQGMNDILGILFIVLYPYCTDYKVDDPTKFELIRKITNSYNPLDENLLKNLFCYLNDYSELESDLFLLFDSFMKRGMKDVYFVPDMEDCNKFNLKNLDKKIELFHTKWNGDIEKQKNKIQEEYENKLNMKFPIQKRINKIFKEYLLLTDKELFNYMLEIKIEVSIFLQRWLRCVLIREFKVNELIKLWDSIFAYDFMKIKTKPNYSDKASFTFLDYLCTYLIHRQRKFILYQDSNNLYNIFLNLQNNQSIEEIVKNSLSIRDIIKSLNDKIIRDKFDSIKLQRINKTKSISYSNCESFKSKIDNNKKCLKNSKEISDNFINYNTSQSWKSINNLNISMSWDSTYIEETKKIKQKLLLSEITKLDHIYLKYKEQFSLKDSREFLLLIIKLKNINLNK